MTPEVVSANRKYAEDFRREGRGRPTCRHRHSELRRGEFGGARVAYLGADRDLAVIIEIFGGTPDDRPRPDDTYP